MKNVLIWAKYLAIVELSLAIVELFKENKKLVKTIYYRHTVCQRALSE